jgi:hypothetical protein
MLFIHVQHDCVAPLGFRFPRSAAEASDARHAIGTTLMLINVLEKKCLIYILFDDGVDMLQACTICGPLERGLLHKY